MEDGKGRRGDLRIDASNFAFLGGKGCLSIFLKERH
jgi:hypothetical protein